MRTLVLDPPTAGLGEFAERRRRSGLDRLDEVWEGVLHMGPAPHGRHVDVQQQLAELLGPLARAAGLFPTIGEFNLGKNADRAARPVPLSSGMMRLGLSTSSAAVSVGNAHLPP
jgi:hypothetical protein